jgi:hypothetical protein
MSEVNEELNKYKFTETFSVEFLIEATDYTKAKRVYDKMFDKNIQLGYDTWKVADKNINGGKFHVKTYDNGEESTLIDEMWGDIGEEE